MKSKREPKPEHPRGASAAHQARLDKMPAMRKAVDAAMRVVHEYRVEADRTIFENWIVSLKGGWADTERLDNGEYRVQDTQSLYKAWLAGQASPYRASLKWFPMD